MSYYAKFSISAECPDKATAKMLADEFRDAICASDEVDTSDSSVYISCYKDIDNEFFGKLTAKYPGTFIAAEYCGEDEEIGVIYAKDGKFYTDFAEVKFPEFDKSKLPSSKPAERVICQSFSCSDDLTQYVDSMLFDSGTSIAQAEYKAGDNTLRVSLEVRGEVAVEFKGITYRAPSEFPDELIERIKRNPGWWDTCAPSGEGTDEPESDVYIGMNNWFEAIWDYRGYSDGVMYEADLANSSKDDVKKFLDEVAKSVIGEHDADILKSKALRDVEDLGWKVHENEGGIEFSQFSPAGEDFSICVNTGSLSVISEAVREYYDGFDCEEHALMAFKMRCAPGLRECLDDAECIDAMLEALSRFLDQAVKDWCYYHGIDDEKKKKKERKNMMETRKVHGGTKFFGPKVDITDPCYNRDVWCRMNDVEIVEGNYECDLWMYDGSYTYDGETYDDTRVAVLGIYLGGDVPEPEEFEEIGEIGVDAGVAGIFNSPKPDFDDAGWAHFCNEISHQDAIINDLGFCSTSGYGDGGYGVFAAKDESGNIVALEIRFIEADEEESEDDE